MEDRLYDAEVIEGAGLVVYPGFIDMFTTLGQSEDTTRSQHRPTTAFRSRVNWRWRTTPPDNRNGLTPEYEVSKTLEFRGTTAEERRKLGFTDLLVAPPARLGRPAVALPSLDSPQRPAQTGAR